MILKNLSAKNWYIILIAIVLVTNFFIILNIPFFRQVFAFLCYTIIPGLLALYILKLDKLEFLKKILLSIGLSITFLMLVGWLLNQIYLTFGVSEPLSTYSLVISFTIILILLSLLAYERTKSDFNISNICNIKLNLKKDQLIFPLIFPIVFPLLAVFGTHLMNSNGNNIILLIMLFLIPVYIIFIILLRSKTPKATYPFAIFMISIALLLMHGLTSDYIIGSDVNREFNVFRDVSSQMKWKISPSQGVLSSTLSVSILPSIYKSFLDINSQYIFKLIFQIIFSIMPLVCYLLFKRFIDELYAFLSSFFLMSQISFLFGMQSAMRQEIAILFFALAMMVLFDSEIEKMQKKVLIIIFIVSTVVSHYGTTYVFFLIILFYLIISFLIKKVYIKNWQIKNISNKIDKHKFINGFLNLKNRVISVITVVFFSVIIFFWYAQSTSGHAFSAGVSFFKVTFVNLGNLFVQELRGQSVELVVGSGAIHFSDTIGVIIHDITFIFIAIGILIANRTKRFESRYLLMSYICFGFLAAMFILPYISEQYSASRTYQQVLVLIAPFFVIGGYIFNRFRPRISTVIIVIVLLIQFFSTTAVIHQISGIPYSVVLNDRHTFRHNCLCIIDQEVDGAKWLGVNSENETEIYCDIFSPRRIMLGFDPNNQPRVIYDFFKKNESINKAGYIYLRDGNVVDGIISNTKNYNDVKNIKDIKEFSHLFDGKSRIYSNGGAEIFSLNVK